MQKKMWKNLMLVVVMAMLCVAVGVTASAEDRVIVDSGECGAEGDNVIWTLYDDGELVISGEGKMEDYGEVYENGGYSSRSTDWYEYNVNRVTIEEGVTYIGNASFRYFSNEKNKIATVTMAGSVRKIGDLAFYGCIYLSDIHIPEGVNEIGNYSFYGCDGLENVEMPNSIVAIGDCAFEYCSNLKKIITSNNLTTIGTRAFSNCKNLESLILPDSATNIGDGIIVGCKQLKNIYLGNGVTNISFVGCTNISNITVSENNNCYSSEDGVLFNKEKTILIKYPCGNTRTSYIVPEGVIVIGDEAFADSLNLIDVKFPNSLTTIGYCAFRVSGLTNINISDGIKSIGELAFDWCFGTKTLTIPQNVENIDLGAFADIFFLENIIIKSMDITLGEYLFVPSEGIYLADVTYEDAFPLWKRYHLGDDSAYEELEKYFVYIESIEDIVWFGTIYCHAGSTAEAYAIENGVDYVLTHFFEGEWTYDYDNMIRYRKCIHCDELETEALETTGDSDVEIIEPVDPDTDFTVDVVEDYVVIEETISNNITTDFEIVKAFDINLKNKDGVHVQPDGTVKVKLPLDWSKDGVYKVYRVNDDGTLTDMNAYRQGSHMVFDTDHFSLYVIVDESEKSDAPVLPDEPQEETKDNFFTRLLDLIKSFFDLIMSWFKK